VLAGIGVSVIPAAPEVVIDPQLILLGLLPPLLYASATSLSATNFRRDFRAISGLSVVLVVISALGLGALFAWLIPDLGFGWGVALGAVLSPTDAVATSIIRSSGVPARALVILDGESLLNDASALVVLRTTIVASSIGFSFWQTLGNFAYSVSVAVVVGALAAVLNLAIRRRVQEEAVSTVLSFTTPFAAAVPVELLHGSGLVAAVVAGLVTGIRSPRDLPPGHRLSDSRNWASVQLVLEGLVFLMMGLQLSRIFKQVQGEPTGIGHALIIALLALAATLLIRAAYVGPLLWGLHRSARHWLSLQPRVVELKQQLEAGRMPDEQERRGNPLWRYLSVKNVRRLATQVRRGLADIDYLSRQPMRFAEGVLVIWAGMRGAVTVAAAQLLPLTVPHRPLVILIAFLVATISLIAQGGSVGVLAARLFPAGDAQGKQERSRVEREQIQALLEGAAAAVAQQERSDFEHRIAVLCAQRNALLDARDDGAVDMDVISIALRDVDVDELVLRLRETAAG
jgi:monovalent cation/hydrogen antiporter